MIKTTNVLLEELHTYANPKAKLQRLVKQEKCFQITKGLYETNKNVPGYLLAGSIYGPSYISFDYALSYYGLIPEAVYTITNATLGKKKKKRYETIFGTFTYRDVPDSIFPYEIRLIQEDDYFYRIAGPEKALCDKLYTLPPVRNVKELSSLLLEDLRIDETEFLKLDIRIITFLSKHYHTSNIKKLVTLFRRMQNESSHRTDAKKL